LENKKKEIKGNVKKKTVTTN